MMVGLLLLALGTVAQAQDLTPPPLPAPVPVLEVMVHTQSGERGNGAAGSSGPGAFETYVTSHECQTGASGKPPVDPPGLVWHITGSTVRRDGETLTVKVDWQRTWDGGRWLESGPRGSQEAKLKVGERIVLDMVTPSPSQCEVWLEASVIERQAWELKPSAGGVSGGGGGRAGAGRSGARETVDAMMRARAAVAPAGVSGPAVDIELWLVDTWTDGSEHAYRQLVPVGGPNDNGAFRFHWTSIAPLSTGRSTIEIVGTIRSVRFAATARLLIKLDRRVTLESATAQGTMGNSTVNLAMPEAGEVVAIEIPGGLPGRPIVAGHQFSIRLRLAPKT